MAARNVIKTIESASPLFGKLKAGDALISINGNPIKDVLDYKFFGYDRKLKLEVLTAEGKTKTIRLRKPEGMDLGLDLRLTSWMLPAPAPTAVCSASLTRTLPV